MIQKYLGCFCINTLVCVAAFAQKETNSLLPLDSLQFSVSPAPGWTALFKRTSGWFGGDGIFAATLNGREAEGASADTSTLIWFSDTMIGDIKNDSLQPGYQMINNSVALLTKGLNPDSNRIQFFWNHVDSGADAVFTPRTPQTQKGEYYWLGDGFVSPDNGKNFYLFGYRIVNIPHKQGEFGFKETGGTLLTVPVDSKPPFQQYRQLDLPFPKSVSWGAGVYVNTKEAGAANADGYVYVYGIKSGWAKEVVIARVKPSRIEDFAAWRFYNGKSWGPSAESAASITSRASNELGLVRLPDGRYALFFQVDGMSTQVGLRLARNPWGPFGPVIKVWDCSADIAANSNLMVYNAKVHPVFSKPGEYLVSYNVNSRNFDEDIKAYPFLYRPRFIWVRLK